MSKITITATSKEATIELQYNGKTYVQKCIPTNTGVRYEGCSFSDETDLPDDLVEELEEFVAYDLMRMLGKANKVLKCKICGRQLEHYAIASTGLCTPCFTSNA